MAIENIVGMMGYMVAGEDLSSTSGLTGQGTSGQFLAAKASTAADFTALHCSTGNERMLGVIQNRPKIGEAVNIMTVGETKVMLGGSVTRGDLIAINSAGRFILATSGQKAVGEMLESGANNEIRTMRIFPSFVLAP